MHINLFTTPLEKSMLEIIIHQLLRQYADCPNALAEVLLLLPNRRSCLECKRLWQQHSEAKTLLLPRMMPIGDMDDESMVALIGIENPALFEAMASIGPAMPPIKRLMALTQQLHRHQDQLEFGRFSEAFNREQMARLAGDILTFMDEMVQYEVPDEAIVRLAPDYFAQHWQRSLAALKFALRWWPDYAASQGQISRAARTNALLSLLARSWEDAPPHYPVIAAGSTGSQRATARLLSLIMRMPNGQVILPGVDIYADESVWDAIAPTHPQSQLKELLRHCQVSRCEVQLLDDEAVKGSGFERARMLLDSALPATLTHQWASVQLDEKAWQGFSVTSCAHEWEEAQLIAVLLRETLETPHKTAALVTHDAALARRVSSLLKRYNVTIDNAMAHTMLDEPFVQFMLLVIHAAANRTSAVPLLALAKHPFCQITTDAVMQEHSIEIIERALFRGIRRHQDVLDALFQSGRTLDSESSMVALALHDALKPLCEAFRHDECSAASLMALHVKAVQLLCDRHQHADQLAQLQELLDGFASVGRIEPAFYPALLVHCLGLVRYIPTQESHPRLRILSPMEARLMVVDRLILGGLNEGSWPHAPAESEWLNTPLRQSIGLPNVLAHIGQEAHDWVLLASNQEVFITRAMRVGGADALPSRWLERMRAMLGKLPDRAGDYLSWITQHQRTESTVVMAPPAPCPPLSARPRKWSVSALDLLLKDPYGYYASAILDLKPLDEIDEEADAAELGSLVHDVMERFVDAVNHDESLLREDALLAMMQRVLSETGDRPQVALVWSPRLRQIANWVVENERKRRQLTTHIAVEKTAQATFGNDVTVTIEARMDRLEYDDSQKVAVVDYKTGQTPTQTQITLGYGAQLPVTALILQANGEAKQIESLEYWKLGSGHKEPEIQVVKELDAALALYAEGIATLITQYFSALRPYYAIPNPKQAPKYNRYARLARIAQWYSGDQ